MEIFASQGAPPLKGQCHEIFLLFCWLFSWISFPPAPEYSIKTVSSFFKNSRRYSQLKVCHRCQQHRWQMEKYINFCLQVQFQVSAAWYCSHYYFFPQIFRRCRLYLWQFATGVIDTSSKFAASIVDTGAKFATGVNHTRGTGGKICHRCCWHLWCTLTCEYLREFSKKFEMILMLLSEAWGKVIHEKNLKQKILWHCPFKILDLCIKIWFVTSWFVKRYKGPYTPAHDNNFTLMSCISSEK